MPKINKLVRDLIPQIITNKGQKADIRILDNEEYIKELNLKLQEEVREYFKDNNCEELADIMEVIYAIAATKGVTVDQLEAIRLKKKQERGGFQEKMFLINTED